MQLTLAAGQTLTAVVHKGIFWAGIGGCVRIGGPAPCVAGPGAAGATVTGVVRAERPPGGGQGQGCSHFPAAWALQYPCQPPHPPRKYAGPSRACASRAGGSRPHLHGALDLGGGRTHREKCRCTRFSALSTAPWARPTSGSRAGPCLLPLLAGNAASPAAIVGRGD